jgi:hypothetical protein
VDKHTAYFNILDALPQQGCAICRLVYEVEEHYIKDILYSKTTSVKMRHDLRASRGFCADHARLLSEIGHALDLSIIYQDVLMTISELLEQPSPRRATGQRGRRRLSAQMGGEGKCPVCTYGDQIRAVYIETHLEHLSDPQFVAKVQAADPLCLKHYRQAIEHGMSPAQFEALRESQTTHWKQLIQELGEFVRKHDHRYRHQKIGSEGDAWIRAIDAITGTREF